MLREKRKLKGSGILVVILSSIAFSIYAMSAFSQVEHFSILLEKYEKNNKELYEKDIDYVDNFYKLYDNNQEDVMYM